MEIKKVTIVSVWSRALFDQRIRLCVLTQRWIRACSVAEAANSKIKQQTAHFSAQSLILLHQQKRKTPNRNPGFFMSTILLIAS